MSKLLNEKLEEIRLQQHALVVSRCKDFAKLRDLIKDLRPVHIDGTVGFWRWKRQRTVGDLIAAYWFPNGTTLPKTADEEPYGVELKGNRADRIARIVAVGDGRFEITYHGLRHVITGLNGAQEALLAHVLLYQTEPP